MRGRVTGSIGLGFAALAVVCALHHAEHARAENASVESARIPGGVAVADRQIGFLAAADGNLEAIQLDTGKVVWSRPQPGEPLVAAGDLLVVKLPDGGQPNIMRMLVLSISKQGAKLVESDPLVFDDWVSVTPDSGRTFSCDASIENGKLRLAWEAHARYTGGAPPSQSVAEAEKHDKHGVMLVDLKTGRVATAPSDEPLPANLVPPAERKAAHSYWNGRSDEAQPFASGRIVSLFASQADAQQLVLKRWDRETKEQLPQITVARGTGLMAQVCLDRRHVMTRVAVPENEPWRVFSIESGEESGTLAHEPGMQAASVVGQKAYCSVVSPLKSPQRFKGPVVQERILKAVDLSSKQELWRHPIQGVRAVPALPPRP